MNVLLGPCPCQGCGIHVFWDGVLWNEHDGIRHQCGGRLLTRARCKTFGCIDRASAKGYCWSHYAKAKRLGFLAA